MYDCGGFMKATALFLSFSASAALAAPTVDSVFWPVGFSGHNEDSRCILTDDPFDVPAYIFAGKPHLPSDVINLQIPNNENPMDLGKCVNRDHYRPVLKLSTYGQNAYEQFEDREHVVVANVRHLEMFYVARIPIKKITAMNFMAVTAELGVMGVRGAHAEMRVFFSEPVKLVAQWPLNSAPEFTVNELIFTGNPTGVDLADRRDALKNFDGSLLHARGIHTIETRLKDTFVDASAVVENQYRMKMNAQESEGYVVRYIALAEAQRLGRQFILTGLNCNSTQFEVLDGVLSKRYKMSRVPYDPQSAEKDLRKRGLIDDSVKLVPFNEEEYSKEIFAKYRQKK
jgi:hypothetical protein